MTLEQSIIAGIFVTIQGALALWIKKSTSPSQPLLDKIDKQYSTLSEHVQDCNLCKRDSSALIADFKSFTSDAYDARNDVKSMLKSLKRDLKRLLEDMRESKRDVSDSEVRGVLSELSGVLQGLEGAINKKGDN